MLAQPKRTKPHSCATWHQHTQIYAVARRWSLAQRRCWPMLVVLRQAPMRSGCSVTTSEEQSQSWLAAVSRCHRVQGHSSPAASKVPTMSARLAPALALRHTRRGPTTYAASTISPRIHRARRWPCDTHAVAQPHTLPPPSARARTRKAQLYRARRWPCDTHAVAQPHTLPPPSARASTALGAGPATPTPWPNHTRCLHHQPAHAQEKRRSTALGAELSSAACDCGRQLRFGVSRKPTT